MIAQVTNVERVRRMSRCDVGGDGGVGSWTTVGQVVMCLRCDGDGVADVPEMFRELFKHKARGRTCVLRTARYSLPGFGKGAKAGHEFDRSSAISVALYCSAECFVRCKRHAVSAIY